MNQTGEKKPTGFWQLTLPYWQSKEKWRALGLLAAIIGLSLGNVFALVRLNEWNKNFYDAIQNLDEKAFFKQLGVFFIIAVSYILIAVYRQYLTQLLQIRWRTWLTEHFVDRWLRNKTYYYWQIMKNKSDNPDQRLTEDIQSFVNYTTTIFLIGFRELITVFSFIAILWGVSGSWVIPNIVGYKIEVHSYMVWACLIYAGLGTWLTHKIGAPLINLNFLEQKFAADFRYQLVRLRENSDSIALAGGEKVESQNLKLSFQSIIDNFRQIMNKQKQINLSTNIYSQLASIFPFLVAAPRLFAKQITMGQLFQINSAFSQVQGSLSFIIDAYSTIASWKACLNRLSSFSDNMMEAEAEYLRANLRLTKKSDSIDIQKLNVFTPEGQKLLREVSLHIPAGGTTIVTGPSGLGKSTLFRTIMGLWPYSHGQITMPNPIEIMVVPQKPYLLVGSLKASVTYPVLEGDISDELIKSVMKDCLLEKFIDNLHDHANWSLVLSPGEQQRISFARVLLHQPKWVFLDEATSALDEATQEHLYKLLKEKLPKTSVVSIAHRESVMKFHSEGIDLGKFR